MSTDRVRLVPLGPQHLQATLAWVNDPEMMRLLGRSAPVTPAEHRQWFETLASRSDCRYFAVETTDTDVHIGNIWLWDIDRRHRRAEVRILFGNGTGRDRGLGSEAIGRLAGLVFGTMDLHRLCAYVMTLNPRAKRAFEKAGFTGEGLLRGDRWIGDAWVDTHILGRVSSDSTDQ